MSANHGHGGIAKHAYNATGGDPLAALLLVLDLIWSGRLVVELRRNGTRCVAVPERLAA